MRTSIILAVFLTLMAGRAYTAERKDQAPIPADTRHPGYSQAGPIPHADRTENHRYQNGDEVLTDKEAVAATVGSVLVIGGSFLLGVGNPLGGALIITGMAHIAAIAILRFNN